MLPLVDDFERALAVIDDEGVRLIYNKFLAFLDRNDVHPIQTEGVDFNTDEHEAVTTFAAIVIYVLGFVYSPTTTFAKRITLSPSL